MMLSLKNVDLFYGGIHALQDVTIEVNEGEIVTLIGSNGAGKSTILKAISRLEDVRSGEIIFNNNDLLKLTADKVVGLGISHVPEGRKIFVKLNVEENLLMGAYLRKDKKIDEDLKQVYNLFPRLQERKKQMGGTLSGGEQQMLAIGRALMGSPKLLMLDEPSMGLAPIIVEEIFNAIKELNKNGLTVLLVEQNANIALNISDIGYVIETGQIVIKGNSKELLHDDRVRKAYLGEE